MDVGVGGKIDLAKDINLRGNISNVNFTECLIPGYWQIEKQFPSFMTSYILKDSLVLKLENSTYVPIDSSVELGAKLRLETTSNTDIRFKT